VKNAQLLLLLPLDFFSPPWLERLLLAPPLEEALPLLPLPEPEEEAEEPPELPLPLPEEDEDFDLLAAMVMLL
jgi:hypothetical protein